jgi:YHS domain-containing protein
MTKAYIKSAVAGALLLGLATPALAGEFGDNCAYNLANGKVVHTNCSVNASIQGKTYCFFNEDAMAKFMQDYMANLAKAKDYYDELGG